MGAERAPRLTLRASAPSSGLWSVRCPDEGTLALYVEQSLPGPRRADVDAHLRVCEACDLLVAALEETASHAPSEGTASLDRFIERSNLAQALTPGAHVGRFEVTGRLGQGAMGVVYAARDPELERPVALKILFDDAAPESGTDVAEAPRETRLLREARTMARLAHPSIVTVYEIGRADGRVFLAMELVEGATLDTWLASRPPLGAVVSLFVDVALAVSAAHRCGVIHRDIKPQNILVSREGRAKVTDFGLASPGTPVDANDAPAALTTTLHRTHGLVGTPAYMAPEALLEGRADARSDQFAVAACLHEALTGRRPYDAANLDALRTAVRSGPPKLASGLPSSVRPILARALSVAPGARFADLGELAEALARANVSASASPQPRKRALRRAIVVAAAVGGVGIAAAVRSSPSSPAGSAAATSAVETRILRAPSSPDEARADSGEARTPAPVVAHDRPTSAFGDGRPSVPTREGSPPKSPGPRIAGRPRGVGAASVSPPGPRSGQTPSERRAPAAEPTSPPPPDGEDWLRSRR